MRFSWTRDGDTLYAFCEIGSGTCYLIVEPVPSDHAPWRSAWHWVAWWSADNPSVARHGNAKSVLAAMTAAEANAKHSDLASGSSPLAERETPPPDHHGLGWPTGLWPRGAARDPLQDW
jgi:hypothetical protein